MHYIGIWIARQFDQGITPMGSVIALVMVFAGIAGAVALAAGRFWIGIPLLGIFFVILGALLVAAFTTDPGLKMSRQEKAEQWKKLPFFLKASFLILGAGVLLSEASSWLMPENPKLFPFTALGAGISCIVFGKGMQKHRPPISVHGKEVLTFESAPDQYLKKLRPIVWSSYIGALMTAVLCVLYFVR